MTGNSGGPMTMAKPDSNRSHDRGRRHLSHATLAIAALLAGELANGRRYGRNLPAE
jgi:hypothetical protein